MPDQGGFSGSRVARVVRVGLGVVVGTAFVVLALRNVDFAEVAAVLAGATLWPLVIAFAAFVLDFFLRAVRFWLMLLTATGRPLPLRPTIGPFVASFGMSDVLPLRVGDGFRILWFSRQFNIPAGTVIGTMIVERILDLVTIVLLGAVSLALVDLTASSSLVRNFQIVLFIAFVAGAGLLVAPALLSRVLEKLFGRFNVRAVSVVVSALRGASGAVAHISSWRRLFLLTLMSLLLWILESVVFIGVWISLGGSADAVMKPFLAFSFSTLGTLVPSLPGHFGPFEFFGLQAFALAGVETALATAVVLLAHLILWAPTALFGVLWLLLAAAPQTGATTRMGKSA